MSPRSNRYRSSYAQKLEAREKKNNKNKNKQTNKQTKGGKGKVTGKEPGSPAPLLLGEEPGNVVGGEEGNLSYSLPLLLFFLLSFQLRALTRAETLATHSIAALC